ncbi:hypothetical protein H6F98_08830 [Microcoleus sp. FACHB-SPT15]|uniref:hypothetical protein n=1 Tax=Microcoleus sp. FACHB-SPT15 TaxID=2692830 RepID=UPI00178451BB|nr:hypothetical protein [Microcoleus sp. FACHB-SPT15]MBD1805550.1 hypothetical protein [Microcoleus sp. FACHB-SPT15]
MSSKLAIRKTSNSELRTSWFERLIAILAVVNLVLVFFDMSYVTLRDFYLDVVPSLTQLYDPVKGIEPHPETQNYLNSVNALEEQVLQAGLQSPQSEELLEELRGLSNRLVEDNPFQGADKSSTLEKIQHEMRTRVGENYGRDAFTTFWSQPYLSNTGWQQNIEFFNTEIRPLIGRNYYRDIGRFGGFVDYFWLIDLPFIILFTLEILARTYYSSRRKPELNWLEAILRRWYDLFLVLPFGRWLRVLPVTLRLYQTKLLDLEPFRKQLNYDFAISFAEEIAEIIGVQVIDQMQESVQKGEVTRWLFHPESRKPYVQVNNTNEVKAIATRLVNVSVYEVLPQVQPDIEALVHHSLESTLSQATVYQQIQNIPGLNHLPSQLTETLAHNLSHTVYSNLVKALEDPVGAELTARLMGNFRDALETELQKKHNRQEFESLLVDMLEEIKINYVRGIAEGGIERALEEVDQLHRNLYQA